MSARSVLSVLDPAKYEVTQIGITLTGQWLTGEDVIGKFETEEHRRPRASGGAAGSVRQRRPRAAQGAAGAPDERRRLLPAAARHVRRRRDDPGPVRNGGCCLRGRGRDGFVGGHGQGALQGRDARQRHPVGGIADRAALRDRKGHARPCIDRAETIERLSTLHEAGQPGIVGGRDQVPLAFRPAGRPDGSVALRPARPDRTRRGQRARDRGQRAGQR